MHLFVEKIFLENFELECELKDQFKNSEVKNKLLRIFTEYPKVTLYCDYKSEEEAINTSQILSLFSNINTNIILIPNFREYFENLEYLPTQSIVLSEIDLPIFNKIKKMGGLHFSYNHYEEEIFELIQSVEKTIDFVNLNEDKFNWDELKGLQSLPITGIIIDDNYVLIDSLPSQAIENNLIPFLKILTEKKSDLTDLLIFTSEVHNNRNRHKPKTVLLDEKYKLISSRLSCQLSSFQIINSALTKGKYEQHDRFCYLDFALISSGKGFNLIPYRTGNITLQVNSIFDKNAYRIMINHFTLLKEVIQKTLKIEVNQNYEFNIYPSNKMIQNRLLEL